MNARRFYHACDATCRHQDVKVAPLVQVPCRDVVVQLGEHHGAVHTCGDIENWDEVVALAKAKAGGAEVAHMGTSEGGHLFKVIEP